MGIWWVNHKQSYRSERRGGYIWSPKRLANGRASPFYDNMPRIVPGDVIISFANAAVSDIGVATAKAAAAAIPTSPSAAGENWTRNDGWLVPVRWTSLDLPVRPQAIIDELRPHLPERYSPIQAETGHGNQGAYLCSVPQAVVDVLLLHASPEDRRRFASSELPPFSEDSNDAADQVIEQVLVSDTALEMTEKVSLVSARRGQGIFRQNVKEIEAGCRLTGVTKDELLVASHIFPWRLCVTSNQRLDGNNGLLLTPNADRLFDRGLIAFANDGRVLVKDEISDDDLFRLGLPDLRTQAFGAFSPQQIEYLARHRDLAGFPV